jgi:hypothetical protein
MSKASKAQVEESRKGMLEILKPGDTVRTILRHVSRSGMCRRISPVIIKDGSILHPDYAVSVLLNGKPLRYSDPEGVRMDGCGMDMGFALVYNLSCLLFPDGFECIGQNCPSNDHSNGDRNYEPHHHRDGGYALKHRWL